MNVSYYNAERYADPTCFEALVSICKQEKKPRPPAIAKKQQYKPMVYICSPFAGNVKRNIINTRYYCRFAYVNNCIPIAPHLHFPQFLDDLSTRERADGLHMGLVLLCKCQELWVFGDTISSGMSAEIEKAKRLKMPIRYFSDKCQEVNTI